MLTRRLIPCVLAIVAGAVATVAADAAWRAELRRPQVVLLGSGRQLSVLVTAGQSRLLLATGDDPVAFGNAAAQVLRPTTPRLDVLLLAGHGPSSLVASRLLAERRAAFVAALGPLVSPDDTGTPVPSGVPVLTSARRFRLADGVAVTVETAPGVNAANDDPSPAWRLLVQRAATTVVVLSDGDAGERFPPVPGATALVVAGRRPLQAMGQQPAPLFAAPAPAVEGRDVRTHAGELANPPRWTLRLAPGETVPLWFTDGALRLPPGTAQPLPPSSPPRDVA